MSQRPIEIVYVCDFANVHSRSYVDYFALRPTQFRVVVVSTTAAPPMDNVEIIDLAPPALGSKAVRDGRLAHLAQLAADLAPRVRARFRLIETAWDVRRNLPRIREVALQLGPGVDIVHGMRTHPEGVLAWELAKTLGAVPLFLSTWGQDFVAWAGGNAKLDAWAAAVVPDVDLLLPDNARDGRIARSVYGLLPSARTMIMPATGGLDVEMLTAEEGAFRPLSLDGWPRLLSVRGYQNNYVQTKVLFEAFSVFLRSYPGARLIVDGRQGHTGAAAHRRWIRRYHVSEAVTQVHLQRTEMFRYMAGCELYVSSTLSDGLPMSLLEALYFGQIPVVTRHESVFPPIVEGVNGFTVASQSADDIASTWIRAVEASANRDSIRRDNRRMISRDFERDNNLARVAVAYAGECR